MIIFQIFLRYGLFLRNPLTLDLYTTNMLDLAFFYDLYFECIVKYFFIHQLNFGCFFCNFGGRSYTLSSHLYTLKNNHNLQLDVIRIDCRSNFSLILILILIKTFRVTLKGVYEPLLKKIPTFFAI